MNLELSNYSNLSIKEGTVKDIIIDDTATPKAKYGSVKGVVLESGEIIQTENVVITTGTFLGGEIHLGLHAYPAGRTTKMQRLGLVGP